MSGQTGKLSQRLRHHYLIAISLSLLSYLFFTSMEAYEVVGEQILRNPQFSDDFRGWKISGKGDLIQVNGDVAEISNQTLKRSSSISQCWAHDAFPQAVIAGIDARSEGLALGQKSWHGARVGLVGFTATGKGRYQLSSRLVRLRDNQPWERYLVGLNVSHEFERVCFVIALYGSKGLFQVKKPLLYPARVNPGYQLGRNLLLVLWSGMGLYWLVLLGHYYKRRPQWGYLIAVISVLAVGILMPNELRITLEEGLFTFIPGFHMREILDPIGVSFDISPNLFPLYWGISKYSHLLGFFLLSGILFSEPKKAAWHLLPGLFLAAVITELLQYFVPGRSPRISDIVVDGMGIVAGWWLVRLYLWRRQAASVKS
jgi:hypothetical protein